MYLPCISQVGTIFAVWESPSLLNVTGRQLVAAGACTYGPRTAITLALADRPGVHEFLLVGELLSACISLPMYLPRISASTSSSSSVTSTRATKCMHLTPYVSPVHLGVHEFLLVGNVYASY